MEGCIVNTIARICELYNEDFKYYSDFVPIDWKDVKTWDFAELSCASPDYIDKYFNQPRFFDDVIYMDNARNTIPLLAEKYDITVVSTGYSPNLRAKAEWIKNHMPYAKFEGVNLKQYSDKSHINMEDGIFLDDSKKNLDTCNASRPILFGEDYPWNDGWNGERLLNWWEVRKNLL